MLTHATARGVGKNVTEGREGDHLGFGFLILFEQKEQEDESTPFGFIPPYNLINLLF